MKKHRKTLNYWDAMPGLDGDGQMKFCVSAPTSAPRSNHGWVPGCVLSGGGRTDGGRRPGSRRSRVTSDKTERLFPKKKAASSLLKHSWGLCQYYWCFLTLIPIWGCFLLTCVGRRGCSRDESKTESNLLVQLCRFIVLILSFTI